MDKNDTPGRGWGVKKWYLEMTPGDGDGVSKMILEYLEMPPGA